jgi:DNA repair protein RadA/Sms
MATDLQRSAPRVHFTCSACGAEAPKWQGRCPACEAWNSLSEAAVRLGGRGAPRVAAAASTPLEAVMSAPVRLHQTGSLEVDRVLGGGIVPGSVVLLGGDPGIGKSTLALQVSHRCGDQASPALYCSGEESLEQLALRARRLGCAGARVRLLVESDVDTVIATIEADRPSLVVVDSVQTLRDSATAGPPGSASQVRAAVLRMSDVAKATGVPVLLVGHVTKEGAIAGPRTLEHMVDVVLYLEGERLGEHRLLRGIKNRFGATGEVGLFSMERDGMRDLAAPGRGMLDAASLGAAGSVLTVTCDGLRPLAVEVQALAVASPFEFPRRTASGFELNLLHLMLAVLAKRAGIVIALPRLDVFVNVAGGIRLTDPGTDLAVALAVAGSALDRMISPNCAVIGELGLGGEVRRVSRTEVRLAEAAAVGMDAVMLPDSFRGTVPGGIRCHRVRHVSEAVALLG